jgi:hypothetical protein
VAAADLRRAAIDAGQFEKREAQKEIEEELEDG